MKAQKGDYGYVRSQKLFRLWRTLGLFAIPVAVFFVGYFLNDGDRRNIYSVIAAVGCIPGALSAVTMITMWLRKPVSPELYQEIKSICGIQTMAYELYVTTHEVSLFLDAVLFSGDTVSAYCDRSVPKENISIIQAHLKKALREEKYDANLKIMDITAKKQFMDRIRSGRGSYQMRDHSHEQGMKDVLLALSL